MDTVQLFVSRQGEDVPALTLGTTPLYVGRSPDSHLVVQDSTVSGRHAAFWVEAGHVWVRDCGSRNGTFVGDEKVVGATTLEEGARIRLGTRTELVVHGVDAAARLGPSVTMRMLEDVAGGVRFPLVGERFTIGTGELADLRVEGDGADDTALVLHDDGEIWRTTLDSDGPIAVGEAFTVAGRTFRVIDAVPTSSETQDASPARAPYRLEVTLDGVTGAEARFIDTRTGHTHIVDAENRAVLVWVLAKTAIASRDDDEGDGWCSDEDVAVGVWGRRGTTDANSLHVLVHRLRKELKQGGFDPWFIEKRRKAIRLALDDISVR